MNRKKFLTQVASATLFLNMTSLTAIFSQGMPDFSKGSLNENDIEKVSEKLQEKFNHLLSWLKESGWFNYINSLGFALIDPFDIKQLIPEIDPGKLSVLKKSAGFEDFGGNKFIEPGYPAYSLLYHIIANPRVRPAGIVADNYPAPELADILEDYIYALKKWEAYKKEYKIISDDELVLAVFAYEYRTAFKTPHHQCAELVYSRTGIGRVGEKEARYDKMNRCYTNNPTGSDDDRHIAVVPARYGLFLAKRTRIKDPGFSTMKMSTDKPEDDFYLKNEDDSNYLIPVRKLFKDDLLIDSAAITFSEKHESRKIASLLDPSFIRKSDSLVAISLHNSSFVVSSVHDKLIQPVTDPATKKLKIYTAKAENGNRYFTSYYNGPPLEGIEIYDPHTKTRLANNYCCPRNLPMYVNISHKELRDSVVYRNRNTDPSFENENVKELAVPLFRDNICDGYISASLTGISSLNTLKPVCDKGVLNAFSIITAPDFFPQVDGFDLQEHDIAPGAGSSSLFFEGGIASLATCSLPPNPIVYEGTQKGLLEINPIKTYTSVVSNMPKEKGAGKFDDPHTDKGYIFSSHLPDMCSSVFAPGWDVTYSNNNPDKTEGVFISTQGLGAPFVEDMKLCAAMNGMWPAASPDASRTYQGSVTRKELSKGWLRNPVSIPLMDDEIGLNEFSPAIKEHGQKISLGWDGEQGPFLDFHNNKWCINFTDLGRADYVDNALKGTFDMSLLRKLSSKELNFRMKCLKKCIEAMGVTGYPNGETDLWLISAEKANWNGSVKGCGIPGKLLTAGNNNWATTKQKGITGDGYLYVFATYTPDKNLKSKSWVDNNDYTKRRRVSCKQVFICQVCHDKVTYYPINPNDKPGYDPSKWQ